jgi:hypothetical protein
MATKSDFTPEEWEVIQYAMMDTMAWISIVDPQFFASFKEATAGAKYLANAMQTSPSTLVRDLAHDARSRKDHALQGLGTNIEEPTLERITAAVALISEKAPDDLEPFKEFIAGLADAAAEASDGISDNEAAAIFKVKSALG